MDDNLASSQSVLEWLTDYTHFICHQFNVPHDQAGGLLQQYLDLKARPSTLEQVMSPYEQPTSYPDVPSSQHYTFTQEQSSSAHLAADLREVPLGKQASLSPHDSYTGEETNQLFNVTATTTHNETSPGLPLPYDGQSGNMMTGSSFLGTKVPSPQSNQLLETTSIGSIKDYDPFWVQHENVDPNTVESFPSAMKFENLVGTNVIRFGDILTFPVSMSINGQSEETEAHLKVMCQRPHREYVSYSSY